MKKIKCTTTTTIPQDVIVSNILPRLQAKSLIRFSCVCKLWRNSILHDPHIASSHSLLYSRKNPRILFQFETKDYYISGGYLGPKLDNHLFYLENDILRRIASIRSPYTRKLVGFCNDLVCFYNLEAQIFEVCNPTRREILAIFSVCNPTRREILAIFSAVYHRGNIATSISCYGFGFDSLTNEYKVVIVFGGFMCMVFTLPIYSSTANSPPPQSSSWRHVTISHDILPWLLKCRFSNINYDDSVASLFCNENRALYWKTGTHHQLVSFDLHDEKFQAIQLPPECVNKSCSLLELKGSLCAARLVRARDEGKHIKAVHLHVLMRDNNNEQVWTNKETFLFDSSIGSWSSRLAVASDQVVLYWSLPNGYIKIYNVHTKKVKQLRRPLSLPFHITSHRENFLSLHTFLHEGSSSSSPKILGRDYPSSETIKDLKQRSSRRPPGIVFLFSSSQDKDPRTEFYL